MATPEGFCPICQHKIDDHNWKLPCGHEYHMFCIRALYEKTLNRRCDITFRRLKPSCPLCRYKVTKKDLPSPHVLNLDLLEQPSISAMPVEERPYRMARAARIIERLHVRRLLDKLMETRRQFLARRQQATGSNVTVEPQAGPSSCNTGANDENDSSDIPSQPSGGGRLVLCSSSSSSQASQENNWQISAIPRRLSQTTSRSRSPLSRASSVVRLSPALQTDGMYGFNDGPDTIASLPRLQQDHVFQDLQREIGILQFQVDSLNALPSRDVEPELIVISDDEESCDEEEDYDPLLLPHEVETRFGTGRGRYTKYLVRWSDGSRTINGTKDVEACKLGKELLEKWRRKNRARNTANCRRRQKSSTEGNSGAARQI